MLDVLIQTYNEEPNLRHTLASVAGWVNRVFVIDSGSTDATVQIAEQFGATVVQHAFEGYAAQKNWALDHLPIEAPWVLILDADESVTPELRRDILAIVNRAPSSVRENGFYINRVLVFVGKKIWHCGYFPSWNLRLFKRGMARYEPRLVHEHMTVDGPTGHLEGLLLHEDHRGLEHFFAKHNRYSTLEARDIYETPSDWPGWRAIFGDRIARRRFLKSRLVPYVPVPWLWRFLYMYVFNLGVLDGAAGWKLSWSISFYEFLIRIKYREIQRLGGAKPAIIGLSRPEGRLTQAEEIGGIAVGKSALNGTAAAREALPAPTVAAPKPASRVARRPSEAYAAQAAEVTVGDASQGVVIEPPEPPRRRTGRVPVSVMIPTLNEAKNLRRCLDHLEWADEVVVVDSGSTDDTVAIAHEYGAKVVNFKWNGLWPKKKNWALRHAPMTHDWVLIVDADEWIVPELASEIERTLAADTADVGHYVNRRFIFMGRWIKHCGYYPSWNLRLIKRGHGEYEQLTGVGNTGSGDNEVHEHVVPTGPVSYLKNDMLHLAFPSIYTFMEKHNRYSNWEAAVQFKNLHTGGGAIGTELSRRRRLKELSRSLPFRPALRFIYSYIIKGGILDGQPGLVFCRLLAIYEYLSVAKYIELKRHENDERSARQLSHVPAADLSLPQEAAS